MRILIYGLNFYPELTGIGKYTGEMAVFLAEQGHEIKVITTPPYYPQWKLAKPYNGRFYKQEQWMDIDVYRCPIWIPKKLSGFKRLIHLISFTISSFPIVLRKVKWQPELIINIAPSLFSSIPALILSKICRAKTWLHIQDFEVDSAFQLGLLPSLSLLRGITYRIELGLFRQFEKISTISNRMVELLKRKGISKNKIILFPNWIDTKLIKPSVNESFYRTNWQISDRDIVVLYSGNMGHKQGLEILLEAARLMVNSHDILFVLCGEGEMKSQLLENGKDLPNVRFYPLQPLIQFNELLNLADIHILPQRADASDLVLPSKLSGMLASGKVVVSTTPKDSELGLIVGNVGVITSPGNVKKLSEILLKLSRNPVRRAKLGEKGRNWVVSNWAKEKVLFEFEAELRKLLE
jgi:colanic acid biosynthesis glycosyl transferase WcaI